MHYALGTAHLAAGNYADAETALTRALEGAEGELKPRILANLGLARLKKALENEDEIARKEQLATALAALEKANELDPHLLEAQRNLEVVLLHLYPPCDRRDDELEPNGSRETASTLSEAASKPLTLCPANEDLFSARLKAGDRLKLTLDASAGRAPGAPRLELLDPSGAIVSQGTGQEKKQDFVYESRVEGEYIVRLYEEEGDEHTYGLESQVLPPCSSLEDTFEENDTQDAAGQLEASRPQEAGEGAQAQEPQPAQLRICPGDEDWLKVGLNRYESLLVQVQYEALEGDVQLEIVNSEGQLLAKGKQATDSANTEEAPSQATKGKSLMASVLDVREQGPIYLRLFGDSEEAEAQAAIVAMVRPPCPEGDDGMEDNDKREDARELTPPPAQGAPPSAQPGPPSGPPGQAAPAGPGQPEGQPQKIEHLLRRCPGDDDWFSLDVKGGEARKVQIGFDHERGDLSLALFEGDSDEPAAVSDTSSAAISGEGLALQPEEDTRYLLKIGAPEADTTNFYQLVVEPADGDGDKNQDQQDQKEDKEEKKKEEKKEQKKPIEQMMDQLDKEKRPNLEAQKQMQQNPNIRAPGGKVW